MELPILVTVMSALAQPTRYRCVEMLLAKGRCTAGDLASGLGVPANTMSSHLTILTHAGLVSSIKEGRHVIYQAHAELLGALSEHLARLSVS
ncbi:ArsR/SmtB family transcription factor [Sphingomonas sp. CFBP 13733]|uniref:ArsR/SmtB family transcription factor n=1 Tax=Sphingomonas sp. CFBP 13733 TaxID=2775291 RepID=UPI00178237FE|nr:metalloregulator ArsR/SmtB family transcription factor [Sphingomonas sp. CFBP 13733]MBD8640261.1 winged helix-turn-helix transcriptional regulator [Sphingomonas sp. CFBP 13733]